jgi:molecular chaperone GrpE
MSDPDYPANEGQKVNGDPENGEPPKVDGAPEEPAASEGPAPAPEGTSGEQTAADVAKLNDQLLRLAAELENTRRRGAREKVDAGKYAIANFARDLIGVADNFERALRAAGVSGDQIPEGHSDAFNGLVAGIQMTEKELLTTLQRHGVQKIEPAGEKFDPNLHQAVANVPSRTFPKAMWSTSLSPASRSANAFCARRW